MTFSHNIFRVSTPHGVQEGRLPLQEAKPGPPGPLSILSPAQWDEKLFSILVKPKNPGLIKYFVAPWIHSRQEALFSQKIAAIDKWIQAGNLDQAEQLHRETRKAFESYKKNFPIKERYSSSHLTLFNLYVLHGELEAKKGDQEAATESFQKAHQELSRWIGGGLTGEFRFSSLRARANRGLGDYAAALQDYRRAIQNAPEAEQAPLRGGAESFVGELNQEWKDLQKELAGIDPAENPDLLYLQSLLEKDLRVSSALLYWTEAIPDFGRLAEALQQHLAKVEARLIPLGQFNAEGKILAQIEALAEAGFLAELEGHPQLNAQFHLTRGENGKATLGYGEALSTLGYEERLSLLQSVAGLGLKAQAKAFRDRPLTSPLKRYYYDAQVELFDNHPEAAQLRLRDFKQLVALKVLADPNYLKKDPEAAAMLEQSRALLRNFALLSIEELEQQNALINASHQGSGMFKVRVGEERIPKLLAVLKKYIQEEKADTVEDALALMEADHGKMIERFLRLPLKKGETLDVTDLLKNSRVLDPWWERQAKVGQEFYPAFEKDPQATHPEVPTIRLNGGALRGQGSGGFGETYNGMIRVVIGREGGVVKPGLLSDLYFFPPLKETEPDRERVVVLYKDQILLDHVKVHKDYSAKGDSIGRYNYLFESAHQLSYWNDETKIYRDLFGTPNGWERLYLTDPSFKTLFEAQTLAGLKRKADPEDKRRYSLEIAQTLRKEGSYDFAAQIYYELFKPALEEAKKEIPQSEKDKLWEEAQAKGNDPEARGHYERGLDQRAFQILDRWKEAPAWDKPAGGSPLDHVPFAYAAWDSFEQMLDPLNKTGNISDRSWDAIQDEIFITVMTAPLTMGAGSAARGVVGGSSLIVRLGASGGVRYFAARSIVFGVGAATETLVNLKLTGQQITLRNFGMGMLTMAAFHGGAGVWKRAAGHLGMGEAAIHAAGARGARTWGLRSANFTGTMLTQTSMATAFSYAEAWISDNPSPNSLTDNFLAHGARNIGMHYGSQTFHAATGRRFLQWEQRGAPQSRLSGDVLGLELRAPHPKSLGFEGGEVGETKTPNFCPAEVSPDIKALEAKLMGKRTNLISRIKEDGGLEGTAKNYSPDDIELLLHEVLDRGQTLDLIPRAKGVRDSVDELMVSCVGECSRMYPRVWERAGEQNSYTGEMFKSRNHSGKVVTRYDAQYRFARMWLNEQLGRPVFGTPSSRQKVFVENFATRVLKRETPDYEEAKKILREEFLSTTPEVQQKVQEAFKSANANHRLYLVSALMDDLPAIPIADLQAGLRLARFIGKTGLDREFGVAMDFSSPLPQYSLVSGNSDQISHPRPNVYILLHSHKKYYFNRNNRVMGIEGNTLATTMGKELRISDNVLFSHEDLGYMAKFAQEAAKNGRDLPPFYDAATGTFRGWVQHPYGVSEAQLKVDGQGNITSINIRYGFYDKATLDEGHVRYANELKDALRKKFNFIPEVRIKVVPIAEVEASLP